VGWTIGVQFAEGQGFFSLHHLIQTNSGACPAFYAVGTGGKATGALN